MKTGTGYIHWIKDTLQAIQHESGADLYWTGYQL
jgi:hypothetical protein